MHLNLNVDFDKSIIKGIVDHKMKVGSLDGSTTPEEINKIVLDVQGMEVQKVVLLAEAPSEASLLQLQDEEQDAEELVQAEPEKKSKATNKQKKVSQKSMSKSKGNKAQAAKDEGSSAESKANGSKTSPTTPTATKASQSEELTFQVGALVPDVGQALTINLPRSFKPQSIVNLRIHYSTNDQATAFSWLTPQQTLGKKMPYLFTQCQFLACRSLAPLQDTPAIKATYTAEVTVPKQFTVKMSANDTGAVENGEMKTYKFHN